MDNKNKLARKIKIESNFQRKMVIFSIVFLGSVSILLYLGTKRESVVRFGFVDKSSKTVYPTLYSDEHITPNAVISDPKFKNISFAPRESQLANVISVVSINTGTKTYGSENGTWLWTPTLDITTKYMDSIISGAKKNGIKNIYLSIDSFLDIYVMPPGEEKDKKKTQFDKIISDFIKKANANDIKVDAEGGWRNWAENGNTYKAFVTIDYAREFNKTHAEKFRGFQYDIEPYLLDSYKNNKIAVLTNFLNLVDQSVAFLNGSDLSLSVVIPEFYDGTNNETSEFSYAGKTGFAVDHLLTILDKREGSKIIVMSYRNWSLGNDGSIEVSKDEITSANKHKTKVVLAQETGDVNPPYITFHNTTHSYYSKQLNLLQKSFSKDKSFGGVATHYINALMALK